MSSPGNERKEWSVGVVVLGVVLAIFFAFSSLYLGLRTGNTICASVPAAVVAAIILRRGSLLQHNMVQTMASAGESLAAGVLFTMPALVVSQALPDLPWYLVSSVALFGGVVGIIFMIRIRRPLIVERDKELKYAEGRATARMLQMFKNNPSGIWSLVKFSLIGVIVKVMNGILGIVPDTAVLKEFSRTVDGGKEKTVVMSVVSDISLAMVAVGVIIGFNAAMLVLIGGLMNMFTQPLYSYLSPDFSADTNLKLVVRFLGIGTMVVAAFYSLIAIALDLWKSESKRRRGAVGAVVVSDNQVDMKSSHQLVIAAMCIFGVFVLYLQFSGSLVLSLSSTVAIVIASGFFSLVASYTVGQLGSTSNPVSGMTISGLLFACLVLLPFRSLLTADIAQAKVILLVIAGVVCCAACTAGAVSQDLKTGFLLKASPKRQQWAMILGTVVSALILPVLLSALNQAYGFGDPTPEHPHPMPAPQAMLMSTIVQSFLTWLSGGQMPYLGMVLIGMVLGLVLVVGDIRLKKLQKQGRQVFRLYPMATAVGIYLGIAVAIPIAIGGLLALFIQHKISPNKNFLPKVQADDDETSLEVTPRRAYETMVETHYVMPAAGLIAGEALVGIIIALCLVSGARLPLVDQAVSDPGQIGAMIQISAEKWASFMNMISWCSFVGLSFIAIYLLGSIRKSSGDTFKKIYWETRKK